MGVVLAGCGFVIDFLLFASLRNLKNNNIGTGIME